MTPGFRRTCELSFAVCAGTAAVGELTGSPAGQPPAPPSPIVACRSKTMRDARAVCWTGTNRADIEALTGRCVADSLCTEGTILVDAWASLTVPLICPLGHWVVAAGIRIVVLSPSAFFGEFRVRDRKQSATRKAA